MTPISKDARGTATTSSRSRYRWQPLEKKATRCWCWSDAPTADARLGGRLVHCVRFGGPDTLGGLVSRILKLAFCYDPNRDFDRAFHVATVWLSYGRWALGADEAFDHPGRLGHLGRRSIKKQFAQAHAALLLVGRDSLSSDWVHAELERVRDVPLLQLFVHGLPDRHGRTDPRGKSPLECHDTKPAASFDWTTDDGDANLLAWVEQTVGRPVPR